MAAGHARGDGRRCDNRIGIATCAVGRSVGMPLRPGLRGRPNDVPTSEPVAIPEGHTAVSTRGFQKAKATAAGFAARRGSTGLGRADHRRAEVEGRHAPRPGTARAWGLARGLVLASGVRRPARRRRVQRPRGGARRPGTGPGARWPAMDPGERLRRRGCRCDRRDGCAAGRRRAFHRCPARAPDPSAAGPGWRAPSCWRRPRGAEWAPSRRRSSRPIHGPRSGPTRP